MNNYIKTLYLLWQLNLPIIKNTALFRSFNGQYNDNPKYVCDKLHKIMPDLKIYWAIGDGEEQTFPKYAKTVRIDSKEYLKLAARAQVVVDNYAGCRTYFLDKTNLLKRFTCKLLSRKRAGQFNLSTWHGTPLKHISLDEPRFKNAKFKKAYVCADYVVAGNEFTARAYKTALGLSENQILTCGTPRNDLLFSLGNSSVTSATDAANNGDSENNAYKLSLKKRLGLPIDKKIALYAPTFRLNVENSGLNQIRQMRLSDLFAALNKKLGGEWAFVFRSHNLVMNEIKNGGCVIDSRIINGNAFDDMAEYLACADVLITDYSSSMFDFAVIGKPCFLFCHDLYDYKNSERGFYMDTDSLPFSIAQSFEELLVSIANYNAVDYSNAIATMQKTLGNAEKGTAAKELAELIASRIKSV